VIARYAKTALRIGPAGAGQLAKMVNQICIAGLLEALSEGLRFAEHAGLDVPRVLEAISRGAAQSWQMENRAGTMLERKFDFGFAVDWMRKDLRIALAEAERNGSELPVSEAVLRFYDELAARGGGRLDTSSLIKRLR
jgi:3-hydroxyisobutyrate dehydrogenase-like beta-hydroxyacid dehydrogenase